MPFYCPVCAKYSDKFPTEVKRDKHLVDVHPESEDARLITERRRKGFNQSAELGKVTGTT